MENVGGPLVRPTSESFGKTRDTSTMTSSAELPVGIRPVKVALLSVVGLVRTKSSAT